MIGKMLQGFLVGMVIGVLGACTSPNAKSATTDVSCADALATYSDAPPAKDAGVARKTTKRPSAR